MKRFIYWLSESEHGITMTSLALLLIIIIVLAYTPRRPITIEVDESMMTIIEHGKVWSDTTQSYVYDQVATLNSVEFSGLNALLGIDQVYDYDWVETAESLGITVDSLTILMYIQHLIKREQ